MNDYDSYDSEELVKVKAYFEYCLYPRAPIVLGQDDNTFGIVRWVVLDEISGHCITDKEHVATFQGEYIEPIEYNTPYTLLGKKTIHPQYGVQYRLLYINKETDLGKLRNQKAFLKTFLTDGQIEELYKVYKNPLKIIEDHDIEGLKKVHGVGDYIANCIINRFEDNKDWSNVYVELDNYGLTPNFIGRLIKRYRSPSMVIKVVKETPYRLCYEMDGVGFKTADNIALKGGLSPKSVDRIKAYIVHFLEDACDEGHSYMQADELLIGIYDYFEGKENIFEEIDVEDKIEHTEELEDGTVNKTEEIVVRHTNNISEAIKRLQEENILVMEEAESKAHRRVYLKKIYNLEKDIARHLQRLLKSENNFNYVGWEQRVKQLEAEQGFAFDETQLDGIKLGLEKQVCFITGSAGTGKSSLVSGILAGLNVKSGRYSFAQTALSGRAAARLSEVTGEEGMTIHRLLEYSPAANGFMRDSKNPLDYDIVILDELSLVGGELFLRLIQAIPDGSKLIMLGDLGQLEAIGLLNLASDFYHDEKIPTVELTKIHRQAAKSGIITSSMDIRHQVQLFEDGYTGEEVLGELQDMILDIDDTKDNTKQKAIGWFQKYYEGEIVNRNIMDIQVIAPVKERGDACVYNLNTAIQTIVNPVKPNVFGLKVGSKEKPYIVHKNDKVMCVKNNYRIKTIHEQTCPIFNGWMGIVKEVSQQGMVINFPLADDLVFIPRDELGGLITLGYASTVHKMQGDQAKVIIGVVDYSTPPKMLTHELLYTLVTRAKQRCVLIGQNKAISQAINTDFVSTKRTFLPELLHEEYEPFKVKRVIYEDEMPSEKMDENKNF